ncbi:MAG: radical SAM protein, partial [Elusimicrobiota bacterium]|nr:radical SAM protein [Elusimicrobiota bacterium]
ARDIARAAGLRYVYCGNIRGVAGQDTVCPSCGLAVITREGFSVKKNLLVKTGACPCGHKIPGVWE